MLPWGKKIFLIRFSNNIKTSTDYISGGFFLPYKSQFNINYNITFVLCLLIPQLILMT